PTRAAEDRHLEIELLCEFRRVPHRVIPLLRAEVDLRLHHLPIARCHIDQLKAADTHPLHPLQVFRDAVLAHIAVGPVPPRPRLGRIGRRHKSLRQRIATRRACTLRVQRTRTYSRKNYARCHRQHNRLPHHSISYGVAARFSARSSCSEFIAALAAGLRFTSPDAAVPSETAHRCPSRSAP